jgi:hypothetical protein
MNLYEISSLENRIERIAEDNLGEVPEALMEELVSEQCKSVQQIENLVKYIRNLEIGIDMCKIEEDRIANMRKKAEKRIDGIEKYLTPYVKIHHKIEVGTFTLTTRKSESIEITNESQIPLAYMHEIPVQLKPDKAMIKKDIKAGKCVPGAELKENDNLNIK